MSANISIEPETQISRLFSTIGQPVRIQILAIIQHEPACVCHFEAVLGMRQASISQHLMLLRKAGLVATQREGRNIFYRLTQPNILDVIGQAAEFSGIPLETLQSLAVRPVVNCPCPQCNPGLDPALTCQSLRTPDSA